MAKQILVILITVLGLISCLSEQNQEPTEAIISSTATVINNNQMPEIKILWDFSLSQDETKLAVFTSEGVFIHDLKSGDKQVVEIFQDYDYSYKGGAIAISPDGNKILISGRSLDQPIAIWDLATLKQTAIFSDIPKGYWVKEIDFAPNGKKVIVRIAKISCESEYDKFLLFDVDGNNEWENSDLSALDRDCSMFPPILSRFTNNDELFVFNVNPPASVFDINTGQSILINKNVSEKNIIYYDVSSDGKTVAARDTKGNVFLLDLETEESITTTGEVLLLSSGNHYLIYDDENRLWSFSENGKIRCSYNGLLFARYPGEFEIGSDNNVFVAYNSPKDELQVWNISSCKMVYAVSLGK